MNRVIKKSVFCVMLITTGMGLGCEAQTILSSQLMSGESASKSDLAITIPESLHGVFHVSLPVVPLDQAAPKLAKIIAMFGNPAVKQQATEFFQAQTPEALEDLNKAAKKALKASDAGVDGQESVNTFTQSVIGSMQQGLQQKHVEIRAALEQEHQEYLAEVRRNARRDRQGIIFSTCMTMCTVGFAYGIILLGSLTKKCPN